MRICFYSAIKDLTLFDLVGFYRDDIAALRLRGDSVFPTNSLRVILNRRPSLVVSYFYTHSVFAALVGRIVGAKVIITGGADQISPVLQTGARLALRRLSALVCLVLADFIFLSCSSDMENFKKLGRGIPFLIRKLRLVPHVVRPIPPTLTASRQRSGTFDAFTLCWLGSESNVRRKGVDRAIRLVGMLRAIGVDARLSIGGADGPGRALISKLVAKLDLVHHVQLLGPISETEKSRKFSESDVYLQLSDYEGFGVAAAEAFFSGMVVVHSNMGGLHDVIGVRGLIINLEAVDAHDINAIESFYRQYLKFQIDHEFVASQISRYSVQARADAFFQVA